MRNFWLVLLGLTTALVTGISQAEIRETGGEYYDKPHRAPLPIQQPVVRESVMGSCGVDLPLGQSYKAQPLGVTCGQTQTQRNLRLPLEIPEDIADEWDVMSRSGLADAQVRMQKIRQQSYEWTGTLDLPVTESWNFEELVGDYDSRFGMEPFNTTCYVDREESYDCSYDEDIRECIPDPVDTTPSFGGSKGGGFSSPGGGGGVFRGGDSGSGERLNRKSWDDSRNDEIPQFLLDALNVEDRRPASCTWKTTGTRRVNKTCWKSISPRSYPCVKQRPKWGTWFETRTVSRRCRTQQITYKASFEKDPDWVPGYKDPNQPDVRSYLDILPNKWDLLPGEQEEILISGNRTEGRSLSPAVQIRNAIPKRDKSWNDYQVSIEPSSPKCEVGFNPSITIGIHTLGRNFQQAPNSLVLAAKPLSFQPGKSRPEKLHLVDNSREVQLQAAEHSRDFAHRKADGPGEAYLDNGSPVKGASASGGYWQESVFKMRLIRKDKWGREVRVTIPNIFNSNVGEIIGDTINVSLEGRDGLDRLYRPGGPFEVIFGGLYKHFGVELTPDTEYMLLVQTVSRGLPFYESGCKGGKAVCEGEEASTDAYSEAIAIPFTTDKKVDNRSWFKKFKDWQENFVIF